MSKTHFDFKQFSVSQKNSAMKIGTDGVLLGAWAKAGNPKRILDIGTGTGLILLMLAQRFPDALLTGIEIEKLAAEEANENILNSKFSNRCEIIHIDLQSFDSKEKFDLIVSNPPFFKLTHPENSTRNKARQHLDLNFGDLIYFSSKLLSEKGVCAFIIPYGEEIQFLKNAEKTHLFPEKITRVKGNENSGCKRSLVLLSKNKNKLTENELVIEISRNIYTPDYIELTKDFYLKM
jgi:tRNA1Val (adenine37-N6)-methyltransferase